MAGAGGGARPGAVELAVALLVAVVVVVGIGLRTNRLEPGTWFLDEIIYARMAEHGRGPEVPAVAPFAYRPGAALLAGAVMRLGRVPAGRAYAAIAWVALPLFVLLVYVLARRLTPSRRLAAFAALFCAAGFGGVKRLLFDPVSPDAIGLLLAAVATLLLVERRYVVLTIVTAVGVTCREFVVVPAVVALIHAIGDDDVPRGRLVQALPAIAGLAVGIAVRLAIPVTHSNQTLDPFVPATYRAILVMVEPSWLTNLCGGTVTFLLPLVCVWRRARPGTADDALPRWAVTYAAVLLLVMLFAGMNFVWFAAYFAPVLAVGYVVKAKDEPRWLAVVLLVLAIATNRLLERLPQPNQDLHGYVGFMSFFGHRLDDATGVRALHLLGAFVLFRLARGLARERAVRRGACIAALHDQGRAS